MYTDIIKSRADGLLQRKKGCMIIVSRNGYAIWENIQHELDDRFKATG